MSTHNLAQIVAPDDDALDDLSCRRFRERPSARGKFIYEGNDKLWVRGVTYGAFRANERGKEYWDKKRIERDFALMTAALDIRCRADQWH